MITRRTARFAQLAHSVEDTCHRLGIEPDPAAVDQALNDRTHIVAQQLGVSPRTALSYAPDYLPKHQNVADLGRPGGTVASLDAYRSRKR